MVELNKNKIEKLENTNLRVKMILENNINKTSIINKYNRLP